MKVEENNLVYAHISKINDKIYIGKTSQEPECRWRHGNGYCGEFKADIEKYGWDNFKHVILAENLDQKAACKLESFYIEVFGSDDPEFGYNRTRGGERYRSWSHSDKSKKKISLNHPDFSGSNNPTVRPVYCVELDRTFWGAKEAENLLGISNSTITQCCRGRCNSAGKHPITGEKLHWKYADMAKE